MIVSTLVLPLVLGAALAFAFVAWARRRSARAERRLHAYALVVAALVYVAFALAGAPGWLDTEIGGVALFGAVAYAGAAREPLWLAGGWAAHVLWDVLLHAGPDAAFVPAWYPALCVGFDLALALYLLAQRRRFARAA